MSSSGDGAQDVITVRLHVLGRVQGVGYRAWAVHTARRLGLSGWVRNLSDGSVEALAHGSRAAIESLIAAAQAGPPGARVAEVKTAHVEPALDLDGFRQLPTADAGT